MNREEHYYASAQLYKDPCAYQRAQSQDYSPSPPPCLYMGRQQQSSYPAPCSLEQSSLPDISPYEVPLMSEDPVLPHLHHPAQPTAPQQAGGYGDPVDLALLDERSRFPLPFPWMKSTKSHAHTWKGQWTGNG
ncbi:PDX1 protein, partial [Amia calva]|nr:PDX1 protein [Amia calva]